MDAYTTTRVQDAIANHAIPRPELLDFSGSELYEIQGTERIIQDDYSRSFLKELFSSDSRPRFVMASHPAALKLIQTAFGTLKIIEDPHTPRDKVYTMSGIRGALALRQEMETPFLKLISELEPIGRPEVPYLMEHIQ